LFDIPVESLGQVKKSPKNLHGRAVDRSAASGGNIFSVANGGPRR
jgi:hypothetical protein